MKSGFIGIGALVALGIVAVGAIVAGGWFVNEKQQIDETLQNALQNVQQETQKFGADATLPIAGVSYTLAGSGVSGSATTITLTSLTIPQTGYLIQDADLSSTFYLTLEPGNRSRQEIVSCTTVVQNGNGTASLSGCTRGLLPFSPYTASSSYQFAHGGGTSVVFSNPPQLYSEFAIRGNRQDITGVWTFASSSLPQVGSSTTNTQIGAATNTLATVSYVNSVASSGAADASQTVKGIVEEATCAELASSTATGGTAAKLFAPASCFSASSTGSVMIPVTSSTGKFDPKFITQSSTYNWNGLQQFTGVVSSTATTTFTGTVNLQNASATIASSSIPQLPSMRVYLSDAVGTSTGLSTTTSATFVLLANSTGTVTTGARRVLVSVSGSYQHTTTDFARFDINIDGTRQGGNNGLVNQTSVANATSRLTLTYLSAPLSAGSHIIGLSLMSDGGTLLMSMSSSSQMATPLIISAQEVYN